MLDQEASVYWGVWPQQQQDATPDYRCAITNGAGMLPYDAQTVSYQSVQARVPTSNYITDDSCNTLPLASTYVPAPGYETSTSLVRASSHDTAATAFPPSDITRQLDQRWEPPMIPASPHDVDQNSAYPQGAGESLVHRVQDRSMSINSDPQQEATRVVAPKSREITPVLAPDTPQSNNPLNNVLRVIQSKAEATPVVSELDGLSVANADELERQPLDRLPKGQDLSAEGGRDLLHSRGASKKPRAMVKPERPYRCEFDGCGKRFAQKAQLKCHTRVHTGEKPYPCLFPGCDRTFSQIGNRSTHHRGHTGEAPFQCHICGKRLQNGGNLVPHMKTHSGIKEYMCLLDNCGKAMSTKGNLKTHQVKYHGNTLEALAKRVGEVKDLKYASDEDRKILEYLKSVHNNLNKGIKGCRGRKIHRVANSPESTYPATPAPMVPYNDTRYEPYTGTLPPFRQIPTMVLNHGYGCPTACCLSRQDISAKAGIHLDIRMHHSDTDSFNGSAASPTSTATYDDDDEQIFLQRHCTF